MSKQENYRRVVVLLGDPRKKDSVKLGGIFNPEDLDTVERLKRSLAQLKGYNFVYLDNHDSLFEDLDRLNSLGEIDYVFNLCDEGFNNHPSFESIIPSRLDKMGIKYTGSDATCLEFCFDKKRVKAIAREMNVPIARDYNLNEEILFPVIIKPSRGDGSVGISQKSVINNRKDLEAGVKSLSRVFGRGGEILIEEFLNGDDLTQGIIGNNGDLLTLPLIQEDYSKLPKKLPKICGYEAKWDPKSEYWKCLKSVEAQTTDTVREAIEGYSKELFNRLVCRDYARFDWRLDSSGKPRLLEANPNPGWCDDGHLGKASLIAKISYPEMLERILKSAERRFS